MGIKIHKNLTSKLKRIENFKVFKNKLKSDTRNSRNGSECSYVGSEVPTAVDMTSPIIWDIMLCSPLKANGSEDTHIASTFRTEGYAKQKTSMEHR
jgi:hypothetical protein